MRNCRLKSPSPTRIRASSPSRTTTTPPRSPFRQTFSESMMNENIENAQFVIEKWKQFSLDGHSSSSSTYNPVATLFPENNDRKEANQYVNAVNELQTTMKHFALEKTGSDEFVRAQSLTQAAMKQLEKEFYNVLKSYGKSLHPDSVSSRMSRSSAFSASDFDEDSDDGSGSVTTVSDIKRGLPENISLMDLKMIADCMISSGYSKECEKIYKLARRSIVDEELYKLGVKRMSLSQVQKMDWETMESNIKTWLNALKISVKSVFYNERLLADYVFPDSPSIAEYCFSEVTREGATSLFSFPESVAKCKKSPEKIFRTLDLYEIIKELTPEIESTFSFDSTSAVRFQAANSLVNLREAVRTILTDFESAIAKDKSKSLVPGGGVHPMTRYVMNYFSALTDYRDSLSDVAAGWSLTPSKLPESYFGSPVSDEGVYSSPVSMRLAWLVLVLLCKLDGKAELYKDIALAYLFLANNLQYVVVKVKTSDLRFLLGDDWVANHEAKVKQYATGYERTGWSKVMTSLPENPTVDIPLEKVKDCFIKFNAEFEEVYKKHSSWVVPDQKLRDEIKISLAKKLYPNYNELYVKYRVGLQNEYRSESLVRFVPDDLGNYLSDLFFGTGGVGSVSSHFSH